MAEQHVVGGSQGWDESTDFNSWVSGQTFKVGDQLGMFLAHNFKGFNLNALTIKLHSIINYHYDKILDF